VAAWVAGGYFGVVVVLVAGTWYVLETRDASGLSSMWVMLATAPTSLVLAPVTPSFIYGSPALLIELAAGGFQAWVLWLLLRGRRVPTPAGT